MNRQDLLKLGVGGLAGMAAFNLMGGGELAAQEEVRKPNVVLILADDLGWWDVGFNGAKFIDTPNLDRLAAQGIRFTNAFACGPNCAPSRACLVSGQYTPRHGIYTVNSEKGPGKLKLPALNHQLESSFVTLAEALKPAGYTSASVGKWHLGSDPKLGPVGQGFDVNVAGGLSGQPRTYFSPYKMSNLKDGPKGEYLTDRLTDEAIQFLKGTGGKPFFLYLPHYAVHTPLQGKPELVAKYAQRKVPGEQQGAEYAAMVENLDTNVGRLLKALGDLKLEDNTLVIFTSDNGSVKRPPPLRGSKGTLYEGGIRVPMCARWPGRIKPGSVCDVPVGNVDFYPTFLEVGRAPRPKDYILDGESLLPLLTGSGPLKRQELYWFFPCYLRETTPCAAVRQGDWKLIQFFETPDKPELYNLKTDMKEGKNLAASDPDKARELQGLLQDWLKRVGAPVPAPVGGQRP